MALRWCYIANDSVPKSKVSGMNVSFVAALSSEIRVRTRPGEMAHLVKHVAHKHADLSSDL